ncbi:hypothetical protein DV737_g2754, partial [Chaetothyriales sp. CBS 132003]
MFNVSCKDPLDAEKIRDRRQRKHKEIQEGIDSINEAVRGTSSPEESKKRRSPELDTAVNPFASLTKTSGSVTKAKEFYNVDDSTASPTVFSRVPSYTSYPIPIQAPDYEAMHSKHCQHLLRKIEMSNDKTTASRLAERWSMEYEDNMEMMHEFHFETAIYSLVSSPESWYLGAKLPDATIHSLGLNDLSFDISSSKWGLPPNILLEQWPEFPQLDYADEVVDAVIVSYHLFESVRCTVWPLLFEQISRVLARGGILIVSVMDVLPQQSGPLLDSWIHDKVYTNVLRRFMVHCPSLLVPSWLEENGDFVEEEIYRDQFPCMPGLKLHVGPSSPSSSVKSSNHGSGSGGGRKKSFRHHRSSLAGQLGQIDETVERAVSASASPPLPPLPPLPLLPLSPPAPSTETQEQLVAASLTGWIHYQRLYANFLPPIHALDDPDEDEKLKLRDLSRDWWLGDEEVRNECDRTKPFFEMTTFVYRRAREADYNDGDGDGEDGCECRASGGGGGTNPAKL